MTLGPHDALPGQQGAGMRPRMPQQQIRVRTERVATQMRGAQHVLQSAHLQQAALRGAPVHYTLHAMSSHGQPPHEKLNSTAVFIVTMALLQPHQSASHMCRKGRRQMRLVHPLEARAHG